MVMHDAEVEMIGFRKSPHRLLGKSDRACAGPVSYFVLQTVRETCPKLCRGTVTDGVRSL